MDSTEHAGSFGRAAQEYDRGRPSYPADAVSWLVPESARAVVDIGAGTGKFTSLLPRPGRAVFAVEPSPEMLNILTRDLPEVDAAIGTAENIPLADASVDVAVVAQAWHWVDQERALPELARVLRPGGQLSMVWNYRTEGLDWLTELDAIMGGSEGMHAEQPESNSLFTPLETHTFSWVNTTTAQGLVDMVASRSYVIVLPDAQREAVLAAVLKLTQTHPDLAGKAKIEVPYNTECWRTYVKPADAKY